MKILKIVTNLVIGQWLERFITWFLKDLTALDWDQSSFAAQLNSNLVEVHLKKWLLKFFLEFGKFFGILWKFLKIFENFLKFLEFFELLKIFYVFEIFTFPSASLADRPETVKPTKLSFKMLKSVPGRAETSKHAFRVEFEISTWRFLLFSGQIFGFWGIFSMENLRREFFNEGFEWVFEESFRKEFFEGSFSKRVFRREFLVSFRVRFWREFLVKFY